MKFKKLKQIFGVVFVFVLILGTNLIDQNNFEKIQESIESIYEDRLVVKGIIYDISQHIHQKELALTQQDSSFFSGKNFEINAEIDGLLLSYEATELTAEEKEEFEALKTNFTALKLGEEVVTLNAWQEKNVLRNQLEKINQNLDILADIQLKEGRREVGSGQKIIRTVDLFTQMEIYGLIILAIIFQLLILYTPKKQENE